MAVQPVTIRQGILALTLNRGAALSVLMLVLAACTMRKSSVWVDPASTAQQVVLGVAEKRGGSNPVFHLNYVAVKSCHESKSQQQTLWEAKGYLSKSEKPPIRIVYGVLPHGFSNGVLPRPLVPGCYEGIISGNGISGTAKFTVSADGSVAEQRADQVSN